MMMNVMANFLQMLILVLGITSLLYIVCVVTNQFIHFISMIVHWWDDYKS